MQITLLMNFRIYNSDSPLFIGNVNDDVVKEVKSPNYSISSKG